MNVIKKRALGISRALMVLVILGIGIFLYALFSDGANTDYVQEAKEVCKEDSACLIINDSPFYDVVPYSPAYEGRQDVIGYECTLEEAEIAADRAGQFYSIGFLFALLAITLGPGIIAFVVLFWYTQESKHRKAKTKPEQSLDS